MSHFIGICDLFFHLALYCDCSIWARALTIFYWIAFFPIKYFLLECQDLLVWRKSQSLLHEVKVRLWNPSPRVCVSQDDLMQIPQDSVCSLINAHVFTRVDRTKQLNVTFCSLVLFLLCLSSQLQAESPHSFYCLQRFLWYEATFYLTTPPLKGIFLLF